MAKLITKEAYFKFYFLFVSLVQFCNAKPTNQTTTKQPLSKSEDNEGKMYLYCSCFLHFREFRMHNL